MMLMSDAVPVRRNVADPMRRGLHGLAIGVSLVLLAGCASKQAPARAAAQPLPADVRYSLRTIGVVVVNGGGEPLIAPSVSKGDAALAGAMVGALGTVGAFIVPCAVMDVRGLVACPLFAALGIAASPIGAAVGATVEAIRAEPTAVIDAAAPLFQRVVKEFDAVGTIRDRLVTAYPARFVVLADHREKTIEKTSSRVDGHGVDAILELSVQSIGLLGIAKSVKPPLGLVMGVRARLLASPGEDVLQETSLNLKSPGRRLRSWIDADGRLLRDELERMSAEAVEKLTSELISSR